MTDPASPSAGYRFGKFLFEPDRRLLRAGDAIVPLSSRGIDLLRLLIVHRDRVVTKDEIFAAVWQGTVVEENNLAVQISALRRALGEDRDRTPVIATVSGRGYRFVAPVSEAFPTPPTAPEPTPANAPVPTPARHRAPLIAAAALVLLALLGWFGPRMLRRPAPRLSIAVLPFRNLSGDQAQDYLADAISDDLTTDLSHLPNSVVIARESTDVYKGRAVDAQTIGLALNVRYLLEGSLRAENATLHINAQLIDATNAAHLWASRFDVTRDNLGGARGEIVRHLASALDFTLVQIEGARSLHERPHNPDAVDLYLRARSTLDRDDSLAGLVTAQSLLERSVAAAPDFADALAQLGLVLLRKIGGFDDPDEWRDHDRAKAVIDHAAALAPQNPLAIAARGMLAWEDDRCAEALPSFRLALSLDPDLTAARDGLAQCARDLGRLPEMIDVLQDTFRIDPAAPGNAPRQNMIGLGYLLLGRPTDALTALDRARAAVADPGRAGSALGWQEWNSLYLIAASWQTGDRARAASLYADYARAWPHRTIWRLDTYYSRAMTQTQGHAAYLAALRAAGMQPSADETQDFGVPPSAQPVDGGDFDPTPLAIPGATRIATAGVQTLEAAVPPALVLDVGRGAAVIPGATLVWPPGVWGDEDRMLDDAAATIPLPAHGDPADRPIVVMGDGTFGWTGYNAALHLVAKGYRRVLWYRGGEEAWVAAGQKSDDRRAQ